MQTLFTYAAAKMLAIAAAALFAALALRWAWRVVARERRRLGAVRFAIGATLALAFTCLFGDKTNSPPRSAECGDCARVVPPFRSLPAAPMLCAAFDGGLYSTNFPPVTNLCLFGVEKCTNSVFLGLAWPLGFAFTNGVADIYGTHELATNRWSRLAGVDVSAASSNVVAELPFTLFPTNAMERRAFFLAATQDDADGDGLPDAYEELTLGTDPTSVDTDGDGMPDDWELLCGLNMTDSADALSDMDSDGLNNISEFIGRTDPRNSDVARPVTSISVSLFGGGARWIP